MATPVVILTATSLHAPLGQGGFGVVMFGGPCVCPQPVIPPTPPIPPPPEPGEPNTNGIFAKITTHEGDALAELASQYRE